MNLLIVDDENNMIRFIADNLDRDTVGISQLFTAQNISEAKQIMRENNIDILLSDIEMPHGTGLDLVEWANTHRYPSTNIIITCHNDFEFAKTAISLGIFSYILKPFSIDELQKILHTAVLKQREKKFLPGEALSSSERTVETVLGTEQEFRELLLFRKLPSNTHLTDNLLNIITVFLTGEDSQALMNNSDFMHLRSQISFMISARTDRYLVIWFQGGNRPHLVILCLKSDFSREDILLLSNSILQQMEYHYSLSIFYHTGLLMHQLPDIYASCVQIAESSVSLRAGIADHALLMRTEKAASFTLPDMNHIRLLLLGGQSSQITAALNRWEYENARNNIINKRAISAFSYAYEMLVFQIASEYAIDSASMMQKLGQELIEHSQRSLADFHNYVIALAELLSQEIHEQKTRSPIISQVVSFIQENYVNDITMNDIADYVSMSKDHLTKVFSQQQGMTPMDYLADYRIEQAKKMLLRKDMNISEAASLCGFNSSSYFCKVFKQSTGLSPKDYRKQH